MSRISTLCVLSATLAVFALSANGASAEPVSVHTNIPTLKPPPPPKTNPGGSKHIEIKDFSFGVENPTTVGSSTGGAGAGKIKFNEFSIGEKPTRHPRHFSSKPRPAVR